MAQCRVNLPSGVEPPFDVFINGVPQREGADFRARPGVLLFERELEQEGRLGFWRWFAGAFGIGTYRRNDTVDVSYKSGDRTLVAHALPIEPPPDPPGAPGGRRPGS
jgi:hypothetical protein